MKQQIKTFLAGGLLVFAAFGVAMAGPLGDAKAAYEKSDYAVALRILRPLAYQGNAAAQNRLGWMYANGQGVPEDSAQAVIWYRKAADQGKVSAQVNLGRMYLFGQGVTQDNAQAVAWCRKAADQGDDGAQTYLGQMYRTGLGVAQDNAQAVAWYRKAADQGNTIAQNNLGWMYEAGQGVRQDHGQAVEWYRKAADQGNAYAKVNLGRMYSQGRGDAQGSGGATSVSAALVPPADWRGDSSVPIVPTVDARGESAVPIVPTVDARGESAVPMVSDGGTFKVPVTISGQLTLKFVVDSGAADVSIPADVVGTLVRAETITDADFLGKQTYQMADGSTVPSMRFVIRSLKVGDKTLENVTGSIAPVAGSLLLGQSFLSRFKSWSIDNQRRALILN